jgi:hypothetical protein
VFVAIIPTNIIGLRGAPCLLVFNTPLLTESNAKEKMFATNTSLLTELMLQMRPTILYLTIYESFIFKDLVSSCTE